jgi:hypothetical protein
LPAPAVLRALAPRAPALRQLPAAVDPGLLTRFRSAGAELLWREEKPARRRSGAAGAKDRIRIAHLHDEEARVLELADGGLVVDSGPVGALVLLMEIDRRGLPHALEAKDGGTRPGFAQGALEAHWGGPAGANAPGLPLKDVIQLARYALV